MEKSVPPGAIKAASVPRSSPGSDAQCFLLQSGDKRVLTAATEIVRKGLASVTLLGDPEAVAQDADRLGLDLSGIKVIDHTVRSHVLLLAAENTCIYGCCTVLIHTQLEHASCLIQATCGLLLDH